MNTEKDYKRIENEDSHTAMMAAVYRFLAYKEFKNKAVGPDNYAQIFLPPKARFFLSFAFFRRIFKKKVHEQVPGSYEYLTARTQYFDDLFYKGVKDNIPQIVVLGAGYDTRAIRFQDLIKDTKVYELDVPTTQESKTKHLRRNKISSPLNITYVPVNFEKDVLEEALWDAGYNPKKKTLFLWEGVTMYITEEAVNDTLSFVKQHSGTGSQIAFDYLYDSVISGTCNYYGAKELREQVRKKGESFTFGIIEGGIKPFLQERGFSKISHFSPAEFEEKYLTDNWILLGKMYGFACHVHAKVDH